MMNRLFILTAFCVLAPFAGAQQAGPATAKRPLPKPVAPVVKPVPRQAMSVEQVISMVRAGLTDDLIIARLRKKTTALDLSVNELISLKEAKVSDSVLKVMMDPAADLKPATPSPVPSVPAVSSVAPASIGVVPVQVISGLPGSRPSGATPGAGLVNGDPHDPMSPHDSGIYLFTKDRDGKPKMVMLERASYQGSKTGGVFTSAVTYGLKKMKNKAVLPGSAASLRSDPNAIFYFYFDDKAAGLGKTMYGMGGISNPNQFALVRLEVKKSNRETITGEMGALGSSSGTHEKSMIRFKSERLQPGLYKVTPELPLALGEYCFLASSGMPGPMMAGAQGAMDIFDFGVNSSQ